MKRILSIILSLCMVASSLGVCSVALASDTVSVECSVCDGGMFIFAPSVLDVSADLSDQYADLVGSNDTIAQPSLLDCAIAISIAMFGDDFMDYAPLNYAGWISNAFGEFGAPISYYNNGATPYSLDEPVEQGAVVEFAFYQDAYGYSDMHTYFNTRSATVEVGSTLTLNLTGEGYDSSWNIVSVPVANAVVTIDDCDYATTDANGNVSLSFANTGDYIISAYSTPEQTPIFAPYCVVTVTNKHLAALQERMTSAAGYLTSGVSSYDVTSAADFLTIINSGADVSAYTDGFLDSVSAALAENDGVLLGYDGKQDLGIYGAVIQCLTKLGFDPTDFYGYNLVSAMESLPANQISSPYYYRLAIDAAGDKYASTLAGQFIADYYTMGSGMSYYGYSCDNTAVLLTAISRCADEYSAVVADAKAVIAKYTKSNGCFYSTTYTDVNADSTAVALMAFASVGDFATANKLYAYLIDGFESDQKGVMIAYGSKNAYATKEALLAFEYLAELMDYEGYNQHANITTTIKANTSTKKNGKVETRCRACGDLISTKAVPYASSMSISNTAYVYSGKAIKPAVTVKDAKGNKIPASSYTVKYSSNTNVGTATVTVTMKGNYTGSFKKTFKINPKSVSISSLTATKKGFTAKWKKQTTQTTGYQIQYSTNSSFKNAKTVTVSKNSTVSKKVTKLSGKKKYFVRIRAYKTVNGTKYYSGWSKAKSVTTKK